MRSRLLKFLALVFLLTLCLIQPSRAQIFGSSITITNGSTNAPIRVNFVIQTNIAGVSQNPRALQVQNISTNETITLEYGYIFSTYGASNFFVTESNQFTFPASNYINGQTWATNFPGYYDQVQLIPYGIMQVTLGSNAVTLQ